MTIGIDSVAFMAARLKENLIDHQYNTVIGICAVAGRELSEDKAARKFWDDMRAAFAEMDTIPKELKRINTEMESLDPSSEAYRALDRRLKERQKDWDQAHRRFTAGQVAFSTYMRAKRRFNSRSENLREDFDTRLETIKQRIDKLTRKLE